MELTQIRIEKPDGVNFILGHAHFIKTAEDLYEAIVQTNPGMKFGIAFCEASPPALLRVEGNDEGMIALAKKNGMALAAGHSFIIFLENGFPINVLNAIKNVPEVCRVYCATANPTDVIVALTGPGRAILGVADGLPTGGVESPGDAATRRSFVRKIGYKLG